MRRGTLGPSQIDYVELGRDGRPLAHGTSDIDLQWKNTQWTTTLVVPVPKQNRAGRYDPWVKEGTTGLPEFEQPSMGMGQRAGSAANLRAACSLKTVCARELLSLCSVHPTCLLSSPARRSPSARCLLS